MLLLPASCFIGVRDIDAQGNSLPIVDHRHFRQRFCNSNMNRLNSLLSLLIIVVSACGSPPAEKEIEAVGAKDEAIFATKAQAEIAIREIDAMRSALARTIGEEDVDQETFARVCKPVGKRAMEIGSQNGWTVRQLAVKYRNPGNKADEEAAALMSLFERDVDLDSMWINTEFGGKAGMRYLRRIEVEAACLVCHGAKDERPEFVMEGYADDRAYDFTIGDLRGVYSVFIPDSNRASGEAQ